MNADNEQKLDFHLHRKLPPGGFLVMIHSALNTINYSSFSFFLKQLCVCVCVSSTHFRSPTINNEILLTHTLTVLSHTDLGSKTHKKNKTNIASEQH